MTKTTEFLIVGAIIGVIGAISGFAVLSARSHTRDVIRLADVRETQMALEMYFQNHSSYPIATDAIPLGQALTACLSQDGFTAPCPNTGVTPYLNQVAIPPASGLGELVICNKVKNVYCYKGTTDAFRIQFELETGNAVLGVAKGLNCMSETGFSAGACKAL